MSSTGPGKRRPGPTRGIAILSDDEDTYWSEDSKQEENGPNVQRLEVYKQTSGGMVSSPSLYSEDDSSGSADLQRTLIRAKSIRNWNEQDINNLYKELETEKRFLKTKEDMGKIQMELKKIKDAGGHVVNLSEKVEGLESALKTAAKDKFDQEKEMMELRKELWELRKRNDTMVGLMQSQSIEGFGKNTARALSFSQAGDNNLKWSTRSKPSVTSGVSIKFEDEKSQDPFFIHSKSNTMMDGPGAERSVSPVPSLDFSPGTRLFPDNPINEAQNSGITSSRHSPTETLRKMKDQEAVMASLHRKIDFLQLQNKDEEVKTLKAQVTQLSETLEKLIGGFQNMSKINPEICAQLNTLKKTLPNVQQNELRNTLCVHSSRQKPVSVPQDNGNKRHLWCTKLKPGDFKEGPVSFML